MGRRAAELPLTKLPRISYAASATEGTPRAIFLHGLLLGVGVERPALHSAPLLRALVSRFAVTVVMPEYHGLYGELGQEPATREPGPVASALLDFVEAELREAEHVDLIAYSLGALFAAKLLAASVAGIRGLILVAPALPEWALEMKPPKLPALLIQGSRDTIATSPAQTRHWLPELTFTPVHGGNHLAFVLPSPADSQDVEASMPRLEQCEHAAGEIGRFCGWPIRSAPTAPLAILASEGHSGQVDLAPRLPRQD